MTLKTITMMRRAHRQMAAVAGLLLCALCASVRRPPTAEATEGRRAVETELRFTLIGLSSCCWLWPSASRARLHVGEGGMQAWGATTLAYMRVCAPSDLWFDAGRVCCRKVLREHSVTCALRRK